MRELLPLRWDPAGAFYYPDQHQRRIEMAGQKAKAAQAQEHHQDLKACCDDDDCCDALTQAKATVEAAGLDYMAILKAMLIALAQALAGGLVKTSAAKKGGA